MFSRPAQRDGASQSFIRETWKRDAECIGEAKVTLERKGLRAHARGNPTIVFVRQGLLQWKESLHIKHNLELFPSGA